MRATIEFTVQGAANMEELVQKATEVYRDLVADRMALLPVDAQIVVSEDDIELVGDGQRIHTSWQADVTIRTRVGE